MAKYDITYSCGHTETKALFGPEEQRRRYRTWAETKGTCEACRNADKALACEAIEAAHDLPVLEGTTKQISWARQIRTDKVAEVEAHIARIAATVPADKTGQFKTQAARIWQVLAERTGAGWWIDARYDAAVTILSKLYKAAR